MDDAPTFLSARLALKLTRDGHRKDEIERLASTDFSGGRSDEAQWARHNERVHVAIVVAAADGGFDDALALARTDWRDALVAAELDSARWSEQLDLWFDEDL